jgi:hypothetical protein
MTPELEFATMTAFDRIDISKGEIDGTIERWSDRFYVSVDCPAYYDGYQVHGTALDAMTRLVSMMDKALTAQANPS